MKMNLFQMTCFSCTGHCLLKVSALATNHALRCAGYSVSPWQNKTVMSQRSTAPATLVHPWPTHQHINVYSTVDLQRCSGSQHTWACQPSIIQHTASREKLNVSITHKKSCTILTGKLRYVFLFWNEKDGRTSLKGKHTRVCLLALL